MITDSISDTENLAAGTNLDIRGGIQLWADEVGKCGRVYFRTC